MARPVEILHLFVAPAHSFWGRDGRTADAHPVQAVDCVHCRAGRGIEGDRFFDYKPDYRGQITFFDAAAYRRLARELGLPPIDPAASHRNVVVEGVDLNGLIGKTFRLAGIRFAGTEACDPCSWMDRSIGPGAEAALRGRGGLRARILDDGDLTIGPAELTVDP